jgi:hypothetical protein
MRVRSKELTAEQIAERERTEPDAALLQKPSPRDSFSKGG